MMLSTLQPFTHLISPSRLPGGGRVKGCVSLEEAGKDDGKIGQRDSKCWVGKQWADSSHMGLAVASQRQRQVTSQDDLCTHRHRMQPPELRVGLETKMPC